MCSALALAALAIPAGPLLAQPADPVSDAPADAPADTPADAAAMPANTSAPLARSLGSGTASYYGRRFHGRRTASGEAFDMHALTAAHRTLPFGTMVKVTNPANGRAVVVRINDRGPASRHRLIDLSRAAAEQIGLIARGHGPVELELVELEPVEPPATLATDPVGP